jgi:hypothetical protein
VEVRVDQRQVLADDEIACRHTRVFAKHRTVTALGHARALKSARADAAESVVEIRPVARYGALSS